MVDFTPVDPVFPDKTSPAGSFYAHSRRAILARGRAVLDDLRARPEKAVLVVSHSGFLRVGVTGRYFMNADYRVFEFDESRQEEGGLRQWEGMESGGMGWSWEQRVELGDGLPEEEEVVVDGAVAESG